MSVGLRVVRGPDWNLGNKDGGEGHVGTIIHDNNNGTWDVTWDMGGNTTCRTGNGGKYDLKIIDNAPIGVRHNNVICDICKKTGIMGIRWKCAVCHDFDLCTPCYYQEKHDSHHAFIRFDTASSDGVNVPKRASGQKTKALGIYPGAVVVRGPDWEYGTQDGGAGSKGLILDVRGFGSDIGGRNAVKVRWANDEANVYRLGCKGKVDLKCSEAAAGGIYCKDHLPVAGAKPSDSKTNPELSQSILKVGDKVCVDLPENALKEVQRGHGGWSLRMTECIGNMGRVKGFHGDDTVEVEYDSNTWQFYVGAVRKVHEIKVGDTVKILDKEEKVKLLQKNHGGWEDDMKKSLGKVGKVVKMDSDGDVVVAFGQQAWVYNPACLIPVQGVKTDEIQGQQDFNRTTGAAAEEVDAGFARLFAHLMLLDALGKRSAGAEQIVTAAAKGSVPAVLNLLKQNKELINAKYKGLTALIIASHQGHAEVVKLLLLNGANMEEVDAQGNTALLAALAGKEEEIAVLLIEKGANVDVVSSTGRTPTHNAAHEGMCTVLKQIIQKGCNPNLKDADGDTPLHDAIQKKSDRAVALLLSHPNIDLKCINGKGFNALQWASFKGHEFAVERILGKAPGIANQTKPDGFTALHIAAINDHREIVSMLILKGKANVNCTDNKGMTPLLLAAHEGYFETVKILMQNGGDVKIKDGDGDTPLHLALGGRRSGVENQLFLQLLGLRTANEDNDRYKIACFMIQNGAEVMARNNRGRTPLEVCRSDKLRDAVRGFIQKMNPQRPASARTVNLADLLTELPLPCMLCMEKMSDARLLPCTHKVVCKMCSFRCKQCPMCEKPITERTDLRGNRIVLDPCQVQ